jgi:hypothetical protein
MSVLTVVILLLPSCAAFYQRGYVANAPNLNCFERENEKNLKFSCFLNHAEAQTNLVIAKPIGLSASINAGFRGQLNAEIAGIYFKRFNEKNYFETQFGYGYTKNIANVGARWSLTNGMTGEMGTYYNRNTEVRFHKIFVQPTYFITDPKDNVNYGLALKISANYFDKYYDHYSLEKGLGDGLYQTTFSISDYRYKWCLALEPAIKIQLKSAWFFQFSFLFTTIYGTTPVYESHDYQGPSSGQPTQYSVIDPQHLSFLITTGFKIKMNREKDKNKNN